MANTQVIVNTDAFIPLAVELSRLGQSLVILGKKLHNLTKSQPASTVSLTKVTPQTDPEMFTQEFLQTVRRSRKDIAAGRIIPYEKVRQKLGL